MSALARVGGWKEQLGRVADLALLGVVAALLSLLVLPFGAVVATLSTAVGHWVEHDHLPRYSVLAAELRRRFLPGIPVGIAAVLATLVVVREVQWLGSGAVPGGVIAAGLLLVAVGCLLAAALLAVPCLADGRSWRSALAAGWQALLGAPPAGAAALGATLIAAVLGALLPGAALVLPAMLVLALHAVRRVLVPADVMPDRP